MSKPDFAAVYLSGKFNPCPCGHYFDLNDMVGLKQHYIDGHFNTDFTDGLLRESVENKGRDQ